MKIMWRVLVVVGAAAVGGVAGYLLQCSGGTCRFTSNPWSGTFFGGLIGFLLTDLRTPASQVTGDSRAAHDPDSPTATSGGAPGQRL